MNDISSFHTNRRTFLKWGASAILTTVFAPPVLAAVDPKAHHPHILSFYNIHTGETLKTCYRSSGKLILRAVNRISHIMRDHRTGEVKPVDPALLDLLHRIVMEEKPRSPLSIISGYRSPSTNEALRKVTSGVALNSLHMDGRAIDIRIPGCQTNALRRLAIDLRCGGVGYYPESDFVHLDTGPVRVW
ncbi:MAG: DUF882 domain-containing protein [Desulfosarcina sp.]|nr:DUF882 domain-containing protein [Desulfosarcina sp.]